MANVPPAVHAGIASSWHGEQGPQVGLLSGFAPADADLVVEGYAACGLHESRRHVVHGWVVSEVARAL